MKASLAARRGLAMLRLSLASFHVSAQSPAAPGDPLPGVTPREFEEFRLGLEDFREIEEAERRTRPAVQRHRLRGRATTCRPLAAAAP